MNLKELIERLQAIYVESIASHPIEPEATVICENTDDDFEIAGIEANSLPGCGCWCGAVINIKRID